MSARTPSSTLFLSGLAFLGVSPLPTLVDAGAGTLIGAGTVAGSDVGVLSRSAGAVARGPDVLTGFVSVGVTGGADTLAGSLALDVTGGAADLGVVDLAATEGDLLRVTGLSSSELSSEAIGLLTRLGGTPPLLDGDPLGLEVCCDLLPTAVPLILLSASLFVC